MRRLTGVLSAAEPVPFAGDATGRVGGFNPLGQGVRRLVP